MKKTAASLGIAAAVSLAGCAPKSEFENIAEQADRAQNVWWLNLNTLDPDGTQLQALETEAANHAPGSGHTFFRQAVMNTLSLSQKDYSATGDVPAAVLDAHRGFPQVFWGMLAEKGERYEHCVSFINVDSTLDNLSLLQFPYRGPSQGVNPSPLKREPHLGTDDRSAGFQAHRIECVMSPEAAAFEINRFAGQYILQERGISIEDFYAKLPTERLPADVKRLVNDDIYYGAIMLVRASQNPSGGVSPTDNAGMMTLTLEAFAPNGVDREAWAKEQLTTIVGLVPPSSAISSPTEVQNIFASISQQPSLEPEVKNYLTYVSTAMDNAMRMSRRPSPQSLPNSSRELTPF